MIFCCCFNFLKKIDHGEGKRQKSEGNQLDIKAFVGGIQHKILLLYLLSVSHK